MTRIAMKYIESASGVITNTIVERAWRKNVAHLDEETINNCLMQWRKGAVALQVEREDYIKFMEEIADENTS